MANNHAFTIFYIYFAENFCCFLRREKEDFPGDEFLSPFASCGCIVDTILQFSIKDWFAPHLFVFYLMTNNGRMERWKILDGFIKHRRATHAPQTELFPSAVDPKIVLKTSKLS